MNPAKSLLMFKHIFLRAKIFMALTGIPMVFLLACDSFDERELYGKWKLLGPDKEIRTVADQQFGFDLDDINIYIELKWNRQVKLCVETNDSSDNFCKEGEWYMEDGRLEFDFDEDTDVNYEIFDLKNGVIEGEISMSVDGESVLSEKLIQLKRVKRFN